MATDSLPGGNRHTVLTQEFTTSADSLEIAKAREARDKEMQGQVINFARDSEVRDAGLGVRVSNALTWATSAGETASAALSSSGRAVAETHETRSLLDQYRDSMGYTVNDDYTVTLGDAGEPTGAAAEALEDAYRRSVSVAEFGAVGDDVTDDTAAIQAAADAAHAAGATLYLPPGRYRTSGTVTLRGSVRAEDSATIRYHGAGTALHVGGTTKDEITWRLHLHLPKVEHRTTAWDGTSVGVRLVNLNACTVTVPYVREFEHGLILEGRGQGCAYNTIHMGTLWCNKVQLWLTADTVNGGYANQNLFLGGRWQLPATYTGGVRDNPDVVQVRLLADDPSWGPNNNLFLNCSLETDNVGYYLMDIGGANNMWMNCRWENAETPARIRWRSGSLRNEIQGGYDLWKLEQVHDGDGINAVHDVEGGYARYTNTSGQPIPNDVRTRVKFWQRDASRLVANKSAEGALRPERGRWLIRASVSFAPSTVGRRQAFLYWKSDASPGPSVLAAAEVPAGSQEGARPTLTLAGSRRFDGKTDVWMEVWQNSGGELQLADSAGLAVFEMEYLGP